MLGTGFPALRNPFAVAQEFGKRVRAYSGAAALPKSEGRTWLPTARPQSGVIRPPPSEGCATFVTWLFRRSQSAAVAGRIAAPGAQRVTVFAAGIRVTAKNSEAAKSLIQWLASPAAYAAINLMTGPQGFERTVQFAIDEDPVEIIERVRLTLEE